ncbi:hypothetical protein BN971_04853 [Mycobacterium bohemicum DSM 44277]|uniref:Secreted protein n=1 Tax=Mycobacterium bohemicum DSM 44277 TaxID=1236609 RepID=A0A0U0WEN5_MYCBE|nr:hypothetical protein BN971_04853 [Mycobacterium bohemicum DSM 44277]
MLVWLMVPFRGLLTAASPAAISPDINQCDPRRRVVATGYVSRETRTYSHSMVPGGLLVMSSTTRLTSGTSLVIRVEMRSSTS